MENNTLSFAVKISGNDISEKFPIYSIETHNFVNKIPFCIVKIIDLFKKEDSLMIQDNSFKIGRYFKYFICESLSKIAFIIGYLLLFLVKYSN